MEAPPIPLRQNGLAAGLLSIRAKGVTVKDDSAGAVYGGPKSAPAEVPAKKPPAVEAPHVSEERSIEISEVPATARGPNTPQYVKPAGAPKKKQPTVEASHVPVERGAVSSKASAAVRQSSTPPQVRPAETPALHSRANRALITPTKSPHPGTFGQQTPSPAGSHHIRHAGSTPVSKASLHAQSPPIYFSPASSQASTTTTQIKSTYSAQPPMTPAAQRLTKPPVQHSPERIPLRNPKKGRFLARGGQCVVFTIVDLDGKEREDYVLKILRSDTQVEANQASVMEREARAAQEANLTVHRDHFVLPLMNTSYTDPDTNQPGLVYDRIQGDINNLFGRFRPKSILISHVKSAIHVLRKMLRAHELISKTTNKLSKLEKDRGTPATHGDYKLENLMYDEKGTLKLGDFGGYFQERYPDFFVATPGLVAPEMRTHRYATPESDLYSIGMVIMHQLFMVPSLQTQQNQLYPLTQHNIGEMLGKFAQLIGVGNGRENNPLCVALYNTVSTLVSHNPKLRSSSAALLHARDTTIKGKSFEELATESKCEAAFKDQLKSREFTDARRHSQQRAEANFRAEQAATQGNGARFLHVPAHAKHPPQFGHPPIRFVPPGPLHFAHRR